MPSPTFGLLDNFNRANGAPGSNWQIAVSTYSVPSISSNAIPWPQFASMAWTTQFGANQENVINVGYSPNAQFELEMLLRWNRANTGHEYGYSIYVTGKTASAGSGELFRYIDGVGSDSRKSLGFQGSIIPANDNWFWAQVIGNDFFLYSGTDGVNFTLRGQWKDDVIKEPGLIGAYIGNNSWLNSTVDNWGGGGIEYAAVQGDVSQKTMPFSRI